MNTNTIQITLEVDDKGTVKIKQFGDETAKIGDKTKEVDGFLNRFNDTMKNLRDRYQEAIIGATILSGAVYGAGKAFMSFVNEGAKAEQIENRLRFALEASNHSWGTSKAAIDAYASSIEMTTRFSDDQARQVLTDMMMYTNNFSKAQMGANLAMDMSVRTGQDLNSSTRLIGMAMNGNAEMLGRYIPELRDLDKILGENASKTSIAEYSMRVLQDKFGGTARNDVNSYAGSVAQLTNSWLGLKKEIGNDLLPTLRDSARETKELIDSVKEHWQNAKTIIEWAYKLSPVGMGAEIGRWTRQKIQEFEVATGATRPDWSKSYEAFTAESESLLRGATGGLPAKEYPMMKVGPDMWDYFKKAPGFIEIIIDGVVEETLSVDHLNDRLKNEIQLKEQLMDLAPKLDRWEFEAGYGPPGGYARDVGGGLISMADAVERNKVLEDFSNIEKKIVDNWEFSGTEPVGQIFGRERAEEAIKKAEEEKRTIEQVGQSIGNIWTSNLNAMLHGQETFAEGFKKIWLDMADYAISQIEKIAANYALFGNMKGEFSSGRGTLGWFGSLLSSGGGGYTPFTPVEDPWGFYMAQAGGGSYSPSVAQSFPGAENGEREFVITKDKMSEIVYRESNRSLEREGLK